MRFSFIVIGRNEEKNLGRCFNSILETIKVNKISDHEILYVDSNSEDRSIEVTRGFDDIRIIKISGDIYNQAIGRNIGAKLSSGDILYFIDGDMEILPEFWSSAVNKENKLVHPFLSGVHIEKAFDTDGSYLGERNYGKGDIKQDQFFAETGGIFMITRDLFEGVGGINIKYKYSEDIDLALRIAKKFKTLHLRKKEVMNFHYTIPYKLHGYRRIFSKAYLYSKSLIYREHLFNVYLYRRLLLHDSTLIVLLLSIVCTIIFGSIYIFLIYVLWLIIRSVKSESGQGFTAIFRRSIYVLIRDILVFAGFFLFFPSKISLDKVQYDIIR